MNRRALGYAALVLLAAAAFWYWPTDRRRIIAAATGSAHAFGTSAPRQTSSAGTNTYVR